MSLREAFEKGKFVVTAEVGPAKGTDISEYLENAEILKDKVDAVNVTDQQSAVMRLGSMVGCIMLKEKNIEPIIQMERVWTNILHDQNKNEFEKKPSWLCEYCDYIEICKPIDKEKNDLRFKL